MNQQLLKLDRTNTTGRTFFTTDIHGSFDLVHDAMKEVAFDTSRDIIICAGDLCDRGDHSEWVLDYLNEPWFYSVRGNHEELLIAAYEDSGDSDMMGYTQITQIFYQNGGGWFLDLVESPKSANKRLAQSIYMSFKSLPLAIELKIGNTVYGVVHAECPDNDWAIFQNELTDRHIQQAQWARTRYDRKNDSVVQGVDWLIVGHTPTHSGEIEQLGNVIYADLGSFFRNKISFIELREGMCI